MLYHCHVEVISFWCVLHAARYFMQRVVCHVFRHVFSRPPSSPPGGRGQQHVVSILSHFRFRCTGLQHLPFCYFQTHLEIKRQSQRWSKECFFRSISELPHEMEKVQFHEKPAFCKTLYLVSQKDSALDHVEEQSNGQIYCTVH